MSGPLSGLRVVEMGSLIAGPFCGQLMGDMGAEVIKIEPPGAGDPMREWGQGDKPAWWRVIARNKKSVSLDLRRREGQEIARRLIARADILIENFRPGTLEEWGLGPEVLHAQDPRLIIVRVSGFGQTGPYRDRAGFGSVAEAMGGWRFLVGEADRPPSRMGVSIGDTLAASYGCMGALAALHHRHLTGVGQVVDSALYEAVLQVTESLIADYGASGHMRERTGAILPKIAPSNVYPCSDGEIVIGANSDKVFARLCRAMGRDGLASDPAYSTHLARGERQAELDEEIAAWTRGFSVEEMDRLLSEHGVPAGPIYRPDRIVSDPHFIEREAVIWRDEPGFGRLPMQNVFPRLSVTPGAVRSPAPLAVGEHNEEVLCGLLGFSAEEIGPLRARGVL